MSETTIALLAGFIGFLLGISGLIAVRVSQRRRSDFIGEIGNFNGARTLRYVVGENILIFGAGPVGRAGAACASTLVETGPIWPPASIPSTTSASTPERTSFLASRRASSGMVTSSPPAERSPKASYTE